MDQRIPEEFLDLFRKPAIAYLGTHLKDGRIQVQPVWCDYADGRVLFNTARGRQKDRNLARDPHATLCVTDPDNAYRYLEVRGRVDSVDDGEAADRHIDTLARRYMGRDTYPFRQPGEVRVMYRIRPERVHTMG